MSKKEFDETEAMNEWLKMNTVTKLLPSFGVGISVFEDYEDDCSDIVNGVYAKPSEACYKLSKKERSENKANSLAKRLAERTLIKANGPVCKCSNCGVEFKSTIKYTPSGKPIIQTQCIDCVTYKGKFKSVVANVGWTEFRNINKDLDRDNLPNNHDIINMELNKLEAYITKYEYYNRVFDGKKPIVIKTLDKLKSQKENAVVREIAAKKFIKDKALKQAYEHMDVEVVSVNSVNFSNSNLVPDENGYFDVVLGVFNNPYETSNNLRIGYRELQVVVNNKYSPTGVVKLVSKHPDFSVEGITTDELDWGIRNCRAEYRMYLEIKEPTVVPLDEVKRYSFDSKLYPTMALTAKVKAVGYLKDAITEQLTGNGYVFNMDVSIDTSPYKTDSRCVISKIVPTEYSDRFKIRNINKIELEER